MQEVYNQLFCLLVFTITGIVIGILFDIFRILRKSFKTADFVTYLQDILFWILTGCIMLFSIFTFNNGEIRSYIFIGIILGVIIYILTISKYFIKFSVIIIKFLKKILSYPICFIKKIIKPVINLFKKIKSNISNYYKKIQNNDKKTHNLTKFDYKSGKRRKKIKEKEGILQKL